ncbi:MAG: tetratricopeptide repeat protein [Gemmatimonadetes bacterium]|nr:tetratricopeptide repeat protein [Gemmatimonadota bacterium]
MLLLCAVLLIGTFALYAPTWDDPWHFDDLAELLWPGVTSLAPEVPASSYRGPVSLWTWAIQYRLVGDAPRAYHALNTLIHAINALLLFALARRWLSPAGGRPRTALAAFCAAVFAAHPLATQAVAYVTQRSTSLAALFFLLAMLGWERARGASSGSRAAWLFVLWAAGGLGVATKHVVVLLPVAILLREWLLPPRANLRRLGVALVPILLLCAGRMIQLAPRAAQPLGQLEVESVATATASAARATYLLTQPKVWLLYARLALWPAGLNLDHDITRVTTAADPAFLLPAVVLVSILILLVRLRRRLPVLALGGALAALTLLPSSSLVPSRDLAFEHRAYLPLAWGLLGLASLVASLPRPRTLRMALASMTIVALAATTHARLQVWDSELALWSDAARKSPDKARPQFQRGLALQTAGQLDAARIAYERAREIAPDDPLAYNNLGNVERALGRPDEAVRAFRRAGELAPESAEPHVNLGNVAFDRGDFAAARRHYGDALARNPASAIAHYDLGKVHERSGRPDLAIPRYEEAARLEPRNAQFRNDLGAARLAIGDAEGAVRDLREALALAPESAVVRYNLAIALEAAGDSADAAAMRGREPLPADR